MPITSAPPPSRKPAAKAAPAIPKTKTEERSEGLQGWGQIGQATLIMVRRYADAGAVGMHLPKICDEIAILADSNEKVAKWVDPIIATGPLTGVIAAVLPLIAQIAVNHKILSAGAMGTVPADFLGSKIELGIAQMQLEALRAQKEAEDEVRAIQEEIHEARAQASNV